MITVSHKLSLVPILTVLFKFLLFDAIWCSYTTFTPFSRWEMYATAFVVTLVLSGPYYLTKRLIAIVPVMILVDVWLVANLVYFRTYLSAIPLSSYLLIGNLSDFIPSVMASFQWFDLLFPLTTILSSILMFRKVGFSKVNFNFGKGLYSLVIASICLLLTVKIHAHGGFYTMYNKMESSAHKHASGPPLFTLFGTLSYDYLSEQPILTERQQEEINNWLSATPEIIPISGIKPKDNCIIILLESFESWVLNLTVENQEITPNLNNLLKESTTLYAPFVLTQVNGGRSIDAQLLILAGMLPLQSGAYSCKFPLNSYYTLPKAMKEIKATHNYLLTVDKTKTWNQGAVARSFGIDTIISYPDFRMSETFGNRKRLGDRAFFQQCAEKMKNGEIWRQGENVFIQMVTYSGHSPFKMPEYLKSLHFSDRIPGVMADYMAVAHYTDSAIGEFIAYLKTRPEYERTMIVITGDHEGLADNRKSLCHSKWGKGVVSDNEFTPLIVLNSPIPMYYSEIMGQVDIYTTLLNLLGLENYKWRGIGQSIFDVRKPKCAISTRTNCVYGDTLTFTGDEIDRIKKSPQVSDLLIRFNKLTDL